MIRTMIKTVIVLMICLVGITADARPWYPPAPLPFYQQHPHKVNFQLWALDKDGMHDYNTNLDQDIAVSIPIYAVKHNWSCVRRAVREIGVGTWASRASGFVCTDGKTNNIAMVGCSTAMQDHKVYMMSLTWGNGESMMFNAECKTE